MDLCRQIEAAGLAYAREATNWSQAVKTVEQAARELRLAAEPITRLPGGKATFQTIPEPEQFDRLLDELIETLDDVCERLGVVKEHHTDLQAAERAALDIRAKLYQWTQPDRMGNNALRPQDNIQAGTDGSKAPAPEFSVRWVEAGTQFMRLQSAPLSIAHIFSRFRHPDQAWVLTSATLSVHGDFSHFQRQLGLNDAVAKRWESPFEYGSHAMLYVPSTLPLPSSPQFNERFVDVLWPLVQKAQGGVLVLCTTLRAVNRIADMLEERLDAAGSDRLLLRQGERSRRVLLDEFRQNGTAILVGSASFWEGIDVPGDALTLVAIDKLPFAPPDDPVLEARLNACRNRGGNPFMEFQLPEAAIALKQGAGRLIRTERDWGVLLVGDTRIVDKPYGKLLWRGLPPFTRTREEKRVLQFYDERQGD